MAKEQGEKDELKGIEKSLHEFELAASALKKDGKGLEFLVGDVDAIVERLKAINDKIAARKPTPSITARREELRREEEEESRRRQP